MVAMIRVVFYNTCCWPAFLEALSCDPTCHSVDHCHIVIPLEATVRIILGSFTAVVQVFLRDSTDFKLEKPWSILFGTPGLG
ncbi:hypothetical protein BKA66DRAFT_478311 [Pyrenochaeta sp. MPI-SDFR-AT-0127]|nr:hypothetical protein BKA66DRAFT_478311 [Pyrenochaeta sp. MPI-SDFR-AT-0127]